MSVLEIVGGNDRRSMIKRYERKSKQEAIRELVDIIHCNWNQVEQLETKLAAAQPAAALDVKAAHDLGHWSASLKHTWPVETEEPQGAWMIGSIDDYGDGDQTAYPIITVEANQYDAPGDSEKIAKAISALWQQSFSTAAPAAKPDLPPMDEHLIYILGRPNFMCHGPAKLLRQLGRTIEHKSEHEQAHVIHWLLNSYLQHGAGWLGACNAEISALNPNSESEA